MQSEPAFLYGGCYFLYGVVLEPTRHQVDAAYKTVPFLFLLKAVLWVGAQAIFLI